MTKEKTPLRPMRMQARDVRTQLGALCWRVRDGKVEVLLVTSRRSGRWVIPKGWPMPGAAPSRAALTEAWEEAGVIGRVAPAPVGVYSYVKGDDAHRLPCIVAVFPVRVKRVEEDFPERHERRRKWFSRKKAARRVNEPELRRIIESFVPEGS